MLSNQSRNHFAEPKLLCPIVGCKFKSNVTLNCFDEHCKSVHKWKTTPCLVGGCGYVAYSERNVIQHRSALHTTRNRSYADKEFRCTWKNCHSSFTRQGLLDFHMNIHTNNLLECSFCPFTTARPSRLVHHYRHHYKVYDYKCDFCGKFYVSNEDLIRHGRKSHLAEMTKCPLCDRYGKRDTINTHLNGKHKVFCKWNKETKRFDVYER